MTAQEHTNAPAPHPGQLAEQRHQYHDLDPDSVYRPAGFYSPACPPREDDLTTAA